MVWTSSEIFKMLWFKTRSRTLLCSNVVFTDQYLRITQSAKLSYVVFIIKSVVYGLFVAFLVQKVQVGIKLVLCALSFWKINCIFSCFLEACKWEALLTQMDVQVTLISVENINESVFYVLLFEFKIIILWHFRDSVEKNDSSCPLCVLRKHS